MSLTLHYAARSDRGLIREANEDSLYAGPRLLAVADGMGGMAAGEVASNIVIAALESLDTDASSSDLIAQFRASVSTANQQLHEAVESNSALEGMGTTLTALLFSGTRIAVGHVGDSRAYVWRDNELNQITRDDTYVQMLVDEGRITADEATIHPQRSLLTRALDGREVEPEFSIREALAGDRYLLCSDGLCGVVSTQTIADALAIGDPAKATDRLIDLALRSGGPDNVTCIVADIVTTPMGSSEPIVAGAAAHDRGQTNSATADSAAGRAALARNELAARAIGEDAVSDTAETSDTGAAKPDPQVSAPGSGEAAPTLEQTSSNTCEPGSAPGRPCEPGSAPDGPSRQRSLTRIAVLLAIIVLIVLSFGYAGWYYTQQQYYVGPTGPSGTGDERHVAIYRGVSGSILGIELSSVVERTPLKLADLPQVQRHDVEKIVTADSKTQARDIVDRLGDHLLPPCDLLRDVGHAPKPSATPTQNGFHASSPPQEALIPQAKPSVNCRETGDSNRMPK
ncbi:MAG: protein phosphatase [Acidimicrobiales bacterium]|nr:MAG: protein phosphatase [Acidimicrobiales bacterium]